MASDYKQPVLLSPNTVGTVVHRALAHERDVLIDLGASWHDDLWNGETIEVENDTGKAIQRGIERIRKRAGT